MNWQQIRYQVLSVFNYRCLECGSQNNLDVQHTDKLNLNVLAWEIKDVGKKAFDPNHIMCTEVFLESDPIFASVNARIQTLKNTIAGIKDAKFANEIKLKEKTSWLPIITSTAGSALAFLGILLGITREFNLKLDLMAYVLYLGIPSAASFLSGQHRHV